MQNRLRHRLAVAIAVMAIVLGLGLLVLELLPAAQIREDLTTSLLFVALLIAWPFAGAIGRPRPRR